MNTKPQILLNAFTLIFTLALLGPAVASAQDAGGAAPAATLPPYARPAAPSDEETIHGRIASVGGAYTLAVTDDRGFVDNVRLHQGTIINPTGITLRTGMSVTVMGYTRGSSFEANQIDTPYGEHGEFGGAYPYPPYGPGYYPYGYPYYPSGVIIAPSFGFGFHHRR
jgi:hypothetical protein